MDDKILCSDCQKKFSSISARNRHIREIHGKSFDRKSNILCPLCRQEDKRPLENHGVLLKHLTRIHEVSIKENNFTFRDYKEFETWRQKETIPVNYACERKTKATNGDEFVYYTCNRSNWRGYVSNCSKRTVQVGQSIKISGVCPSRIVVKILKRGTVNVKFTETHVGHEDELRTRRLMKEEEKLIVEKLNVGISHDRILHDVRKIEGTELQRIALVTRKDLNNLVRKYNIDKKRDANDMVATALKVEEWNSNGKKYAFLFKKIGEPHPILQNEDFALGFMNAVMENKLKNFKSIICMDGTHGTNQYDWDLTILLIKDENNTGFPVAFFLSNRRDQIIQEVFFRALKEKLGEKIEVNYIMTDDDPKYYNAWTKIMTAEKKPRHLLCTWHVIKNWNIQGRNKLKNNENRVEMKKEMRKILKETNVEKFTILAEKYFEHLQNENETDFLNYLKRNYFQNQDRIMKWAHCYRLNVGINTNMAIESLNKVLKYNKMQGNRKIRVEKLLDLLDDLVDDKMWKTILNTERPNANNFQHRMTIRAHKAASNLEHLVQATEFGKFQVNSSSQTDKYYTVSYNQLCPEECKSVYCPECKVCIHRYNCECAEFVVKSAMCKHIHMVAQYERKSEFLLASSPTENDDLEEIHFLVEEPSTSKYQEEVSRFLQERCEKEVTTVIDEEVCRQIKLDNFVNFAKSLDNEMFEKLMNGTQALMNEIERKQGKIGIKRKIEKQSYFPNKK